MIDTGEGPTWSDITLFPPWIADDRDGTCFRNLPAMAFKRPFEAGEGHRDGGPADVAFPFHAEPIATVRKDNPHAG